MSLNFPRTIYQAPAAVADDPRNINEFGEEPRDPLPFPDSLSDSPTEDVSNPDSLSQSTVLESWDPELDDLVTDEFPEPARPPERLSPSPDDEVLQPPDPRPITRLNLAQGDGDELEWDPNESCDLEYDSHAWSGLDENGVAIGTTPFGSIDTSWEICAAFDPENEIHEEIGV
jgi:hypothetical protein